MSTPDPSASSPADSKEVPCQQCGEMVRVGLVRCWKCGNFMRADIAQRYQQMLASERPVIYSQSETEDDPSYVADDDDFELADGFDTNSFDYTQSNYEQRPEQAGNEVQRVTGVERSPEPPVAEPEPEPVEEEEIAEPEAATEAEPAAGEQPPAAPNRGRADAAPDQSHSDETGGDVLLDIALQEERAAKRRRRMTAKSADGFFVNCPNTECNALIEVRERHRGRIGKCPKCSSPYLVPVRVETPQPSETGSASEGATTPAAEAGSSRFPHWMRDVKLHLVDPAKLKLKPGSLEQASETVDIGFGAEGLLVLGLGKFSAGVFGIGGKPEEKKEAARKEIDEYLSNDGPLTDIPAATTQFVPAEETANLRVAQPSPAGVESMFADIEVFGDKRIAIRLPEPTEKGEQQYVSFHLSGYRQFLSHLKSVYGEEHLSEGVPVPTEDVYTVRTSHYTEEQISALDYPEWSEADPDIELEETGYQCQSCHVVISEDGRKKEKIGGKSPKGLAKAKCPKCEDKFGSIVLKKVKGYEPPQDD